MKRLVTCLLVSAMLLLVVCGVSAQLDTGDKIIFGRYEQDGDPDNGPEEIEWQVLASENGRALLISCYGLDVLPYHSAFAGITWEQSSLRAWLNSDFYDAAFADPEKELILSTDLSTPMNPVTQAAGGDDTKDRVFLLSIQEAEAYFHTDDERKAAPSEFAKDKSAQLQNGFGKWWLRTPGSVNFLSSFVMPDGKIGSSGAFVQEKGFLVRPVLWLQTAGEVSSPAAVPQLYTVAEGDTCESIAGKFGVDLNFFMMINRMTSCELKPGDQILIPGGPAATPTLRGPLLYTVQKGDTCTGIAENFGVDYDFFMLINRMSVCTIYEGELLMIPAQEAKASPQSTPTAEPTLGPIIPWIEAVQPTETPTVAPTPKNCSHSMEYVTDVTIPDGMQISAGASFTKIWRIKNTGNCPWTTDFSFEFVSGSQMGGMNQKLLKIVQPGDTVDLSVDMVAPYTGGTYKGNWQLKTHQGYGIGPAIWVEIRVPGGYAYPTAAPYTWASPTPDYYAPVQQAVTPEILWFYPNFYTQEVGKCVNVYWGVTGNSTAELFVDGVSVYFGSEEQYMLQICSEVQSFGPHEIKLCAYGSGANICQNVTYVTDPAGTPFSP